MKTIEVLESIFYSHLHYEGCMLHSKAAINQPTYAILEKLQLEMSKAKECRYAIIPIGKFVPSSLEDLPIASGSTLNNVLL